MNDDLFRLGERIVELAARINIATYEMLTLIAEFDRREGWAEEFTSCADWLAWRTGRMLGTARENVRVAHALESLPLTSAEMKLGKISYTKVRTMTRVATLETEEVLLEYARTGSAAKLEQIVRGWKHLSRDGELTAEEARHQSRAFSVAIDGDGMYVMRGRLEPEAGAVLMRAIEAASDALYRTEHPDARPRSRQRRADAAGLVAERALAAGFGGESGTRAERYQVAVHTEMATLEKDGDPGRSEVDGVRVSAETSRRMACDAAVVPMTHLRRGGDGGGAEDAHHPPAYPPRAGGAGPGLPLSGVRKPVHRGASCHPLGRRGRDEPGEHGSAVPQASPCGPRGPHADVAEPGGTGRVLHEEREDDRECAAD